LNLIDGIESLVEIIPTDQKTIQKAIQKAIKSDFKDFKDAIQ
jgi:hypothetical protein